MHRVCTYSDTSGSLDLVHVVHPRRKRRADLAELLARKLGRHQRESVGEELVVHGHDHNVKPLFSGDRIDLPPEVQERRQGLGTNRMLVAVSSYMMAAHTWRRLWAASVSR